MRLERLLPTGATEFPTAKYVFGAIVVLLVAAGAGHWYLLQGRTDLYFGVPLWLWLQLVIIAGMLVLAWVAVTVWTRANDTTEGGSATGHETDNSMEGQEW